MATSFFIRHAYWIVFLWVLVEQLGFPVPSTPILLTAGTLTATGHLDLSMVLVAALGGSLLSDSLWYWLGKRYGGLMGGLVFPVLFVRTGCGGEAEEGFSEGGAASLLIG